LVATAVRDLQTQLAGLQSLMQVVVEAVEHLHQGLEEQAAAAQEEHPQLQRQAQLIQVVVGAVH
jgi:uncharacterized membrane protein